MEMKSLKKILLLSLLFILSACHKVEVQAPTVSVEIVPEIEATEITVEETPVEVKKVGVEWPSLDIFSQNLVPSETDVLYELQNAPFYILDFALDDNRDFISGTVNIRYTNRYAWDMDFLILQLFPVSYGDTMEITIVNVNNQPANLEMVQDVPAIKVLLLEPLLPGESCELNIPFTSTLSKDPEGSYGLYGNFDDVIVLDGFYPQLATFDEDGNWQTEFASSSGDIKFEEISFYQVFADLPASMKTVTSGQMVSETIEGNRKHVEYIAGPVREFFFAGSEKFVSGELTVGDIRIVSTGFAGDENVIDHALEITRASVEIYGDHYVPYPYREVDVVSLPLLVLGMEYPGVSAINSKYYDYDGEIANTSEGYTLDSVIAHEMGHQWFFNLVGNDQIAEPWLDEAITQFATSVFFKGYYGEELKNAYKETWNNRWSRVDFETIPIGKPSYEYEGSEYSAIVYGRGPYFIEALENKMGRDIFTDAMKIYVENYSWKIADCEEFKDTMEMVCECDLTNLFDKWVTP